MILNDGVDIAELEKSLKQKALTKALEQAEKEMAERKISAAQLIQELKEQALKAQTLKEKTKENKIESVTKFAFQNVLQGSEYWCINNNFWDTSKYTLEQATVLSKTMVESEFCIDCEEVTHSMFCIDCIKCHGCYFCAHCFGCYHGGKLFQCKLCVFSEYCVGCDECYDCKYCYFCVDILKGEHKSYSMRTKHDDTSDCEIKGRRKHDRPSDSHQYFNMNWELARKKYQADQDPEKHDLFEKVSPEKWIKYIKNQCLEANDERNSK